MQSGLVALFVTRLGLCADSQGSKQKGQWTGCCLFFVSAGCFLAVIEQWKAFRLFGYKQVTKMRTQSRNKMQRIETPGEHLVKEQQHAVKTAFQRHVCQSEVILTVQHIQV